MYVTEYHFQSDHLVNSNGVFLLWGQTFGHRIATHMYEQTKRSKPTANRVMKRGVIHDDKQTKKQLFRHFVVLLNLF